MADARDWPEMLVGLYDKLAGGGAEISCSFDHFEVKLPPSSAAGAGAAEQTMRITGTIKVAARRGPTGRGPSGGGGGGRR